MQEAGGRRQGNAGAFTGDAESGRSCIPAPSLSRLPALRDVPASLQAKKRPAWQARGIGGYTVSQNGMSSSKSGTADPADDVDDSAMAGAESPAA